MSGAPPAFGERVPGVAYRLRPGAYGILVGDAGRVALVHCEGGWHLPGGGQEAGEELIETLHREVAEECALEIKRPRLVLVADQFTYARDMQEHLQKRCHVFVAQVVGPLEREPEAGHVLAWVTPAEALGRLTDEVPRRALRDAVQAGL